VTEADTNQVLPFASAGLTAGTASAVPPVATGQVETQTQLSVVFALQ
jgi:hypothetical protein